MQHLSKINLNFFVCLCADLQEWCRNGAGMRNEDKLTTKSIKSFASSLVNKRVALNTLRELLGHSSEEMVLRYAHIHDQTKAGAEALLTT